MLIRKMNTILVPLLLLMSWSNCGEAQIYFPNDDMLNNTALLAESRGKATYESTVDSIISKGVLKLTLSLQKYMGYKSTADNVVFSPVNVGGALALVLLASSGKTFQEMAHILGLASGVDIDNNSERVHQQIGRLMNKLDRTSSFDIGEEIKLATAVFVQENYPIRDIFRQTAQEIYKSEVVNVDFYNGEKAKQIVNSWVSDRTYNKIKTMLEENPPLTTKVIITSALYFKAAWEKPFFDGLTRKRPFYTNGREKPAEKTVDMMSNGGLFPYYRDRKLDCEIMGFPYKENKSTMYVVMPNHSDKQKLLEFQNRVTPEELERLVDNTRYTQSVIAFPKMTLESSLDLSGPLIEFGAKSLFNPREANLGLLSPGLNKPAAAPAQNNYAQDAPVYSNNNIRSPLVETNNYGSNNDADNDDGQVLIFSRSGAPADAPNCTEIFDPTSNLTNCKVVDEATHKEVVYKKFGDKVGRRITRDSPFNQNIDKVRQQLSDADNPGLYADKVLHKVFMEITESGTEASAATSVSLTRGGDITIFRVDQPFMFFIMNHETRLVLFWGSVTIPTPSYAP